MPRQLDLTGWWYADVDNALYYIRHLDDNSLWWAGVRAWWGFHTGLEYTNVFHGVVNPSAKTIEGSWADVPRGGNLKHGRLSLDIVEIVEREVFVGNPNRPFIPPGGPPYDGPPPRSRFELRQKPEGTTGGFANRVWQKTLPIGPISADYVRLAFSGVRNNGGNVLGDKLVPCKDFAVVWGHIGPTGEGYGIGWDLAGPRDYCSFFRLANDHDGDITFDLGLDTQDRRDLDTQPEFWVQSSGWIRPASDILAKLNDVNKFHTEVIMFAREEDEDHCADSQARGNLPGWMEAWGNSVLVNGLPINGNVYWVQDHVEIDIVHPGGVAQRVKLPLGVRIRVTGVIALDKDHDDKLEIHPVYTIDLPQDFAQPRSDADLTGVWHADDVGTYYLRQVDGNTLWWLGLSRDQGVSFANVFHGTIEGNTIRGEWADIPVGGGGAQSSGRLTLAGDGSGQLTTTLTAVERTGGFGGSIWRKLYDRPFRLTLTAGPSPNTA